MTNTNTTLHSLADGLLEAGCIKFGEFSFNLLYLLKIFSNL